MKLKIDTDTFSVLDLHAAWFFIGTIIEQRDPEFFSETRAVKQDEPKDANPEAGTTINGKDSTDPIKLIPDFDAKDSLPADAFEQGKKAEPIAPAPLPPNVAPLPPLPSNVTHLPLPAPPGPAPAPEFDSTGVAWDMNLHSSTKSKTIDGKWKARRNRSSGASEVPAGTAAPLPPLPTSAAAAPLPPNVAPAPLPPNLPPPSVIPPDASDSDDSGELPANTNEGIDFPSFIAKITAGMQTGAVTQLRIAEVLAKHKLDSLFSLNTQPGLVAAVARDFGF